MKPSLSALEMGPHSTYNGHLQFSGQICFLMGHISS